MISLDQVQLLEKKVEAVVNEITKLQNENDFLRTKFSELKVQNDSLQKSKTELEAKLSLYEQNQPRIEQGIKNALEFLNNVEDSVLRSNSIPQPVSSAVNTAATAAVSAPAPQSAPTQVQNTEVQAQVTEQAQAVETQEPLQNTAAESAENAVPSTNEAEQTVPQQIAVPQGQQPVINSSNLFNTAEQNQQPSEQVVQSQSQLDIF